MESWVASSATLASCPTRQRILKKSNQSQKGRHQVKLYEVQSKLTHQDGMLHEVSADSDPGIGFQNRYDGTDGVDGDSGQGFHFLDLVIQ